LASESPPEFLAAVELNFQPD